MTLKKKNDPQHVYKYALKNSIILTKEEEKVFIKDPFLGVRYSLEVKNERLYKDVEKYIYTYFTNNIDKIEKLIQIYKYFFKYIGKYGIVNKNKFLKTIPAQFLHTYAVFADEPLAITLERKMFNFAIKHKELWNMVEYSSVLMGKLPEEMHNYMIAQSLCETLKSQKSAISTYFKNLKKYKKMLIKLTNTLDKNMTIQQVIDSL
jgi:hypothetical protein